MTQAIRKVAEPRATLPNGDNVSLRELYARQELFKEYVLALTEERDRRYSERFEAQETALVKADLKLTEYKDNSNEWRSESKDRAAEYPTRNELEALLSGIRSEAGRIDKEVRDLRETRSASSGRDAQTASDRGQANDSMKLVLTAIGIAFSAGIGAAGIVLSLSK